MNFAVQDKSPEPSKGAVAVKKYVFVCGMPRSGTTILAKEIAGLTDSTGFKNTGVGMDEGQYLQDIYSTERACGGAGRFGFDPRAHLTEDSPLLTPDNVARLHRSWEPYWDGTKSNCVEKSPGNLLKTRFLQAAFPNAYFVVVKRHPVAASLAVQKWTRTPLHELFAHWLVCNDMFNEDKKRLHHVYELTYAEFVAQPEKCLEEIAKFIGTGFSGSPTADATEEYNAKYFQQWANLLENSQLRYYYRCVARDYEARFARHGYSLNPLHPTTPLSLSNGRPVRPAVARILYLGAETYCHLWRAELRLRVRASRLAHQYLPPDVRAVLGSHGPEPTAGKAVPGPAGGQTSAVVVDGFHATQPASTRPVFILGCPRSGTTLLYDMIQSSGLFARVPFESDTFRLLAPRFPRLGTSKNRKKLLDYWYGNEYGPKTGLERRDVERRVDAECRHAGDFLRIVMEEMCRKQGAIRWAEKTPDHALYVPVIKRFFPDALLVHIIRDGRDAALSLANYRLIRPYMVHVGDPVLSFGVYWKWIVRKCRNAGRRFGRDYYELRYEDLVQHPRSTLAKLGDFMGLTMDYEQILQTGLGSVRQPDSSFPPNGAPAGWNPVGRWKSVCSPEELAAFEAVAGDALEEFGYRLATGPGQRPSAFAAAAKSAFYASQLEWIYRLKLHTPLARLAGMRGEFPRRGFGE